MKLWCPIECVARKKNELFLLGTTRFAGWTNSGRPTFLTISQDLTEGRKLELENEMLRSFVVEAPVGLIIIRLTEDDQLELVFTNNLAANMGIRAPGERLWDRRPFFGLFPHHADLVTSFKNTRKHKCPISVEDEYRGKVLHLLRFHIKVCYCTLSIYFQPHTDSGSFVTYFANGDRTICLGSYFKTSQRLWVYAMSSESTRRTWKNS